MGRKREQISLITSINENTTTNRVQPRITKQQQNFRGPGTDPMDRSTIKPGQEGGIKIPKNVIGGYKNLLRVEIPED